MEEKVKESTKPNINTLTQLSPWLQLRSKQPCLESVQVEQYSLTLTE